MDKRKGKILFNKSGGTATGENAYTCRVTIPTSWIKKLEITKENREVELIFDEETKEIIIKK